ncbi:MAG: hypothetical protein ACYDB8_08815 [Acidiferrobacterales bacterium]
MEQILVRPFSPPGHLDQGAIRISPGAGSGFGNTCGGTSRRRCDMYRLVALGDGQAHTGGSERGFDGLPILRRTAERRK